MKGFAINLTMSWRQAARVIEAALTNGTTLGREEAREQLTKMAMAADLAVDQEKLVRELRTAVQTLDLQKRLAVELIDRFLGIDDWTDESLAPRELIESARELVKLAKGKA